MRFIQNDKKTCPCDNTPSCCFTGYRPEKFPFDFNVRDGEYYRLENRLVAAISELSRCGIKRFFCGGARGFDLMAAECVLILKQKLDISLCCVIPFKNHENGWSSSWKRRYNAVLSAADEVVFVCNGYSPDAYQKRNRYMVDRSQVVVTYFSGIPGGTKNTVAYARKKGLELINIYEQDPFASFKSRDYVIYSHEQLSL